ncbi:MAG: GTPase HflX [Gammaproteobacteria bacterium]|nr:GTPase HflX [Gammaproteobacteria bacterium]
MIRHDVEANTEKTILVHQRAGHAADDAAVEELRLLAESAGAVVCELITGHRRAPQPSTFIGKGKLDELRAAVAAHSAELVVINHSISPVQERNLERSVGCRVLDRTGLILDIFAQRASSHEGKMQVELAQLRHLSTRLVRGWTHLERQKGGIGLRGPGESQLETDRRLIGQRIKYLRKKLDRVSAQRGLRRKARHKVPVATVSLVGYTNAGKSSLFNRLTGADVFAEDRLFATLDPTMRRLALPGGKMVVLSDTVGFIRAIPHTLVKAFHSTLEEVGAADLLLHVVDVNSEDRLENARQVDMVLNEIGADTVPVITVFNKTDLADIREHTERSGDGRVDRVWLSARTGAGADALLDAIQEHLSTTTTRYRLRLPAAAARLRSLLYEYATVASETPEADGGWVLETEITEPVYGWLCEREGLGECDIVESAAPIDNADHADRLISGF